MTIQNAPSPRAAAPQLHALLAANGRLWAGEAEVFAAYFASPQRSASSDEIWLARQCFKEMVDGVVGRLTSQTQQVAAADAPVQASRALADVGVRAELAHYIAFKAALQVCRTVMGVDVGAEPAARVGADWPENIALQTLRARHRRDHGVIGLRAEAFTEGGYCTLYRAGMALRGGTVLDDAIATACAAVFDDEWDHMLAGIAGLVDVSTTATEWQLLQTLTLAQGRHRIAMRNAQFGAPLPTSRIAELQAGALAPLPFDYARAGIAPPN